MLPDFYVGTGTDTTILVIDFKDGTFDSSYSWGYLYNSTRTGEDLLNAIAAADQNLFINIDTASFGNFLQDISYIKHAGLGGLPDYWSTWEGPDMDNLISNNGIASPIIPGGVFGVSYTNFNPPIQPGEALKAYDPGAFKFNMVDSWYGNGSDSLVMIVDFSDSTDTTSYAWGYLFNDSVSYLTVLDNLTAADTLLTVTHSGSVISIGYRGLSGMVSALTDWYVWEAENFGNWRLRYGDEVFLHPGDFGAVVFTRFLNPVRPVLPFNINRSVNTNQLSVPSISVYPNPVSSTLRIEGDLDQYSLYNLAGELILTEKDPELELEHLPKGTYLLEMRLLDGHTIVKKVFKD